MIWPIQSIILGAKVGLALASAVVTYRVALRLAAIVGAFDWSGKAGPAGGVAKTILGAIAARRMLGKICLRVPCPAVGGEAEMPQNRPKESLFGQKVPGGTCSVPKVNVTVKH